MSASSETRSSDDLRNEVSQLKRLVVRLAELAKCSASNIPLIELGRSSIQLNILCKLAHGLQVEPFDLLNHDPENNDIGYILEKMRQDPTTPQLVKAQLEAWNVAVGRGVLP